MCSGQLFSFEAFFPHLPPPSSSSLPASPRDNLGTAGREHFFVAGLHCLSRLGSAPTVSVCFNTPTLCLIDSTVSECFKTPTVSVCLSALVASTSSPSMLEVADDGASILLATPNNRPSYT